MRLILRAPIAIDVPSAITAMALAAAMVLGGGGSAAPLPEMLIEGLFALFLAGWAVAIPADRLRAIPGPVWRMAGMILALPLIQMIPLPPFIWHHLPGRMLEFQALALVGAQDHWQPLSLTPSRTLASFLAMAPAAAMLVMVAALSRDGRNLVLLALLAVAELSLLVGAAQLSGGIEGDAFHFYKSPASYLNGFQANHNNQADVLLIAMVVLAGLAREVVDVRRRPMARRYVLGFVGGGTAVLLLGIVLTASRGGIALVPVALAAQWLVLRPHLRLGWRTSTLMLIAVVLAGLAGLALLSDNVAIDRVLSRFHNLQEFRPEIWRDAIFAIGQYWPWGAGLGSFVPVFTAIERLEVVSQFYTNRAHNDYLELLIEAGIVGAAVFGVAAWQIGMAAWRGIGNPPFGARAHHIAGLAILFLLGTHSVGDYPLRSISLACIAACGAGLLFRPKTSQISRYSMDEPA